MELKKIIDKYKSELPDLEALAEKYPECWSNIGSERLFHTHKLNKCYDKLIFVTECGQGVACYGEYVGKLLVTDCNTPISIFLSDEDDDNLIIIDDYRNYKNYFAGTIPEEIASKIDAWLVEYIKNEKLRWKWVNDQLTLSQQTLLKQLCQV